MIIMQRRVIVKTLIFCHIHKSRDGGGNVFERNIYDQYGFHCDERWHLGAYEGFESEGHSYIVTPYPRKEDSVLTQFEWARQLERAGIIDVAMPVQTMDGKVIAKIDGAQQLIFRLPQDDPSRNEQPQQPEAFQLAQIHEVSRGWMPNVKDLNFLGNWLHIWETRMSQLENWHQQVDARRQKNDFDRQFLYTFPYYLGRAETAMQWLVEEGQEHLLQPYDGSINHTRFTPTSWFAASPTTTQVKLPLQFVYDHPARDLGERLRSIYRQGDGEEAYRFIEDYYGAQFRGGNNVHWPLIGARLLLPLSYVEVVEDHYMNEGTNAENRSLEAVNFEEELAAEEKYLRLTSECLLEHLPSSTAGAWFTRRIFV